MKVARLVKNHRMRLRYRGQTDGCQRAVGNGVGTGLVEKGEVWICSYKLVSWN